MSIERCFMCDTDIDTDVNVEHFYESDCAVLAAQQKLSEIIVYRDTKGVSTDVYKALCAGLIDVCGDAIEMVLSEECNNIKQRRKR